MSYKNDSSMEIIYEKLIKAIICYKKSLVDGHFKLITTRGLYEITYLGTFFTAKNALLPQSEWHKEGF